jgi:hypothetical protein
LLLYLTWVYLWAWVGGCRACKNSALYCKITMEDCPEQSTVAGAGISDRQAGHREQEAGKG